MISASSDDSAIVWLVYPEIDKWQDFLIFIGHSENVNSV